MSLIVRNPENDEDYRKQQEFFKKYPNAGKYDDMSDFYSRGVSSFTEEKLKDYKESGLLAMYKSYRKQKQDRSKKREYEVTDVETGEEPDYDSKWNGIRQGYDSIPTSEKMPKSEYQSLKLGSDLDDREVLVANMDNRDKEVPMTTEDYKSVYEGTIFDLPEEYTNLLSNKWKNYHVCHVHDYEGMYCNHKPMKDVYLELEKELERGTELTPIESDLYNISIFDSVIDGGLISEVVSETNREEIFTLPHKFTEALQHSIELDKLWIKIDPMFVETNGDRYTFFVPSSSNPNIKSDIKPNVTKLTTKQSQIKNRTKTLLQQLHDDEQKDLRQELQKSFDKVDEQFDNFKRFSDKYVEETQRTPLPKLSSFKRSIINLRTLETLSYKPKLAGYSVPYQNVQNFHIKKFDTPFVARDLSKF